MIRANATWRLVAIVGAAGLVLAACGGDDDTTTTDTATDSSATGTPLYLVDGNIGNGPLTVTGLTGLTAPFAISGGSCGATPIVIAGGASCTINITFAPTTTSGTFSQVLQIVTDAPSTTDVTVNGSVSAPASLIPSNTTWGLLAMLGLMLGLGGLVLRQRGA